MVEDDQEISAVVRDALTDDGYDAVIAPDGQYALDLLRAERDGAPRVILLDVKTPRLDGWSFLQQYRALPVPQAKVILVTASVSIEEDSLPPGADALVRKPFDLEALLELVAQHVHPG